MIKNVLFFGLIAISIISCNPFHSISEKTDKKYQRLGAINHFVETDSSTIHIREITNGNEPVLVLVHGFGPMPHYQWKKVVKDLSAEFTLLIPDLIYFEKSTSLYQVYGPEFQSSQLIKAIHKLGYPHYYIAGLSYGGMVSSIIAHQNPHQVEGLILIDALHRYYSREYSDSIALSVGEPSIDNLLIPGNGKEMKKMLKLSYYKAPLAPTFILNKGVDQLYNQNQDIHAAMLQYLRTHEESLKKLDLSYDGPVNIIWGREDHLIPLENAYKLESYYPNVRGLTILDKTGHAAQMESPRQVAEDLHKFIYLIESGK